MARREYQVSFTCAEKGCKEWTFFIATSQREAAEIRKRYIQQPWLCTRHTQPDEVLSSQTPERVTVKTAVRNDGHGRNYWDSGSGFAYGPGFKAYADDFPPGTRLVITARVELPEGGDPGE